MNSKIKVKPSKTMAEEQLSRSDHELLEELIKMPGSAQATIARELLEYKRYRATKRHNRAVLIFSVAVTVSTVLQAFLALTRYAESKNQRFFEAMEHLFFGMF